MLSAANYPASHVLNKSGAENLSVDWAAHNSGSATGEVLLRLVNLTADNRIIAIGLPFPIPAGGDAQLGDLFVDHVGLLNDFDLVPGANTMRVDMLLLREGGNLHIASHSFTVNFT